MQKNFNIYADNKLLVYTTNEIDALTRSIVCTCEQMGKDVSIIETIKTTEGIRAAEVYNTNKTHLDDNGKCKNKITILFN